MFRISVLALGIVALLSSVVGAAASLGTTSDRLGAGSAAVASCGDVSGATVTYTEASGAVTHVSVGSLPVTCNGGTLTVTLTSASGSSVAAGSATVAAGAAANIAITPQPASSTVALARVLIEGP